MWGHKMYTLFGILALAFAMLLLVTCFITIAFTYFQLILEDYRWFAPNPDHDPDSYQNRP